MFAEQHSQRLSSLKLMFVTMAKFGRNRASLKSSEARKIFENDRKFFIIEFFAQSRY